MNRIGRPVGLGTVLLVGLLATACSSETKLYPVSGKVTVKGQPAVGALVIFFPEGSSGTNPSTGVCGEDGTFTLTTGTGEGAPAGKYIVTISWPDPKVKVTEQQKMMGLGGDAPDLLKEAYSKDRSPLKAEVKPEKNTLEPFALK